MVHSKNTSTRFLALSCAEVESKELMRRYHYASIDWRERMAVALHPLTPPLIRDQLKADGLRRIRRSAEKGALNA
jgi:hypothetical protein